MVWCKIKVNEIVMEKAIMLEYESILREFAGGLKV